MIVDYLGHSGFLVETDHVLMLFDYYVGDLSLIDEKPEEKPLFVFASHVHADHFQPKIFGLAGHGRDVRFLLSDDIRGNASVAEDAEIHFLKPDREYGIPELGTVRTLLSTDEGVAFLVKTEDAVVYHAGDLNWWD
ncbi:MAG: MBL fold metallo-hydrolase, partial [Clostridia bacterium]|nr:MBL fold metallo-hydrolase [Clostridia bacterium]